MEETVSAVYPFAPPKLDEVFYEVKQTKDTSTDTSIKEEAKVVEVPVYKRAYTALEAHYPEEPISNINPEHPPAVTYEATRVVEGWEKGRGGRDSGYASRNGSYGEAEIKEMKVAVEKPKTETVKVEDEKPKTESLSSTNTVHKDETGHEAKKDDSKTSSEV